MTYFGDFPVSGVVDLKFTSRQFSSGAPFLLAGSPLVRVYKSTGTTEDDSGITLTTNFDGVTGLNHVSIDLSADGTFYAAGSECQIVLTAGTVDGVSVAGETLGSFSIERAGAVLALAKGANGFSAIKTQAAAIEVDTQDIQSRLPAALVSGRMDSSVGAMATDTITSGAVAASAVAEIQSGLASQSSVDSIGLIVTDILTDTGTTIPSTLAGLATAYNLATVDGKIDGVVSEVGFVRNTTDKLDDTLEDNAGTYRFTYNALEEAPAGASVSDIFDEVVDGAYTFKESMRLNNSAMWAKLSGASTTTIIIRDVSDTKDRITATVDADGNRTAITVDAS